MSLGKRRSISLASRLRSALEPTPQCARAPLVTGERPARALSLSTKRPCASVKLNACTNCRLGPRVGVSFTRYAFNSPRSVTITKELGVMANHGPKKLVAHQTCVLYLYKLIRFWQQDCVAEFLVPAAGYLRRARSSSALNGGNSTRRFFQDSSRACACVPLTSRNKEQARPPRSTSSPEANFLGSARNPSGSIVSRINCHSRCSWPGRTNGIGS